MILLWEKGLGYSAREGERGGLSQFFCSEENRYSPMAKRKGLCVLSIVAGGGEVMYCQEGRKSGLVRSENVAASGEQKGEKKRMWGSLSCHSPRKKRGLHFSPLRQKGGLGALLLVHVGKGGKETGSTHVKKKGKKK